MLYHQNIRENMAWRWRIAQAAEIRWWQSYLKNKGTKTYLDWKKNYWQDFLKQCSIDLGKDAFCLDVGCGPAGVFTILEEQRVVALDPLLDKYEDKIKHFDKNWYANTDFVTTAFEDYYPSERFDVVFCLNVINHVRDWEASMQRLWSCVTAGGKMVLSVDAHNYRLLKRVFRFLPGDILHPQQHDLEDYKRYIQKHFFGLKSIKSILIKEGGIFNYYALVLEKD